jgi:hypothetical protein
VGGTSIGESQEDVDQPAEAAPQRMPRHPEPFGASEAGPVLRRDRLGGVIHEYVHRAA